MTSPYQSAERIGIGLVLTLGIACGTSKETSSQAMHTCAPATAQWVTGTVQDGGGVTSAGLSCPGSISTYCAVYATWCPPTAWADAIAGYQSNCSPFSIWECDHYNLAAVGWACGGDTSVYFVYAKATGQLEAAVETRTAGGQICLGGPPTFEYVTFCDNMHWCDIGDGGADAATGGDASPE